MDAARNAEYWRSRTNDSPTNKPAGYARFADRSRHLIRIARQRGWARKSVLELGCNCGRNLAALWDELHCPAQGVDINPSAKAEAEAAFGERVADRIMIAELPASLAGVSEAFDVVLSMAFLVHLCQDDQRKVLAWLRDHAACSLHFETEARPERARQDPDGRIWQPLPLEEFSAAGGRLVKAEAWDWDPMWYAALVRWS